MVKIKTVYNDIKKPLWWCGFWTILIASSLFMIACTVNTTSLLEQFVETEEWRMVGEVKVNKTDLGLVSTGNKVLINGESKHNAPYLKTREVYSDLEMTMEFMLPEKSNSGIYFMGRYEIQIYDSFGKDKWDSTDLGSLYQRWDKNKSPRGYDGVAAYVNASKPAGEWQQMEVVFRAPRFAKDGTKISHAHFVKVLINGQLVLKDIVAKGPTRAAIYNSEAPSGPLVIQGDHGPIAIRALKIDRIDLEDYPIRDLSLSVDKLKEESSQAMLDLVGLGKDTFSKKGCAVCHSRTLASGRNRSGPSLYGLFTDPPQKHFVFDTAEGKNIELLADDNFLHNSVRQSDQHLAKGESTDGNSYPPLMPSYSLELLSELEVDGLAAFLKTLNSDDKKGPSSVWVAKNEKKYVLSEDPFAVLVDKKPRLTRVNIGPKHSGRAYQIGLSGGRNYSFDPRTLGIVQVWSGPFVNLRNERDGRANKASTHGVDAKIWNESSQHLFHPLYSDGKAVDFSFKEPQNLTKEQGSEMVNYQGDYLADIRSPKARFLGLSTPATDVPSFRYQVNGNRIDIKFVPKATGIEAKFSMELSEPQSFLLPEQVLSSVEVSEGTVSKGVWTVPAGNYYSVNVSASYIGAHPEPFVDEKTPNESSSAQALVWTKSKQTADLLRGYTLFDGSPPLDRFGRQQLFEPLGIDFLNENVAFVSTRTAGVWKIVDGNWHLFAEGTFESLGVLAESQDSVIVGEKPGLTKLIDADGDHWSERRENISDEFRFTSNYHEYLHGPVKYKNSYLYTLNLSHNAPGAYHGGGRGMTSSGGYRGWLIQIDQKGDFQPFASGLRSPAGLAISPDEDIFYTENQGQFVGTSKIFKVKKGKFYGHPASLIDLPGMHTQSPEIQWKTVSKTRERPVALLPHNHVMNSPGNPVWDTTQGDFGPFSGQMLLGDQTLSSIYRIDIEEVNGIEQGAVLPFADNLASGVMRLVFNPNDNSLWIGQTARGWSARGGKLSALQRIDWDGSEPNAIKTIKATSTGFEIVFTKAQIISQFSGIQVDSWYYADSPKYGSSEIGFRKETLLEQTWSDDKRRCLIKVKDFAATKSNVEDTSRVYRIDLQDTAFGLSNSAFHTKAYYTLHTVPK